MIVFEAPVLDVLVSTILCGFRGDDLDEAGVTSEERAKLREFLFKVQDCRGHWDRSCEAYFGRCRVTGAWGLVRDVHYVATGGDE